MPSILPVSLSACPPIIVLNAGLAAVSKYRWEITSKFGTVYNGVTTTDAAGLLAIDTAQADLPPGLFLAFSGSFLMRLFTYKSAYEVAPTFAVVNGINYDIIELTFKDYRPGNSYFISDAPVYTPPLSAPQQEIFTDTTLVIITHGFGYKPFVQVLDTENNIIGCNVTHGSNNAFSISFDTASSGFVLYR